jgi:hypothetical protein
LELLPVDVVALVAVVLTFAIPIIPLSGFVLKRAFKPVLDAAMKLRDAEVRDQEIADVRARVEALERQLSPREAA